ncbi:hypothetical protein FRC18_011929 [Serendipita sp. 400]|nr:hypothetical protein FRC18_011929 [Serendipita sp. 400]
MNASINDLADFSRGVLEEAEKRGSSSGLLARLTRRFQKAISLHSEIPSLGTARNVGELSNAEDIVAPTESSVAKEPETRASTSIAIYLWSKGLSNKSKSKKDYLSTK